MDSNYILNNFNIPNEAREFISNNAITSQRISDNTNFLTFAGHDKGISYRFFVEPVIKKVQSEELDMNVYGEDVMIEWFVSKKLKPTEKVRFLPKELLRFKKDAEGKLVPVSGQYLDAYNAFMKGITSNGTLLTKWKECSTSALQTLNDNGIYTVEQLAALSRDHLSFYPESIKSLFEKAIREVNTTGGFDSEKYTEQLLKLKEEKEAQNAVIEELKSQVKMLVEGKKKNGN